MNEDQFNELLAYTMLAASNSAVLFQQNQRKRALMVQEIDQCQADLLKEAQQLKESLAKRHPTHEYAPVGVPPAGRSDT